MKRNFKGAIQEHINGINLNRSQLRQLDALQKSNTSLSHQYNNRKFIFAMVASIFIILIFSIFTTQINFQQDRLITQIASEVAKNHLKLKPLEVKSSQIAEVQNYFDKLDFLPISSLQFKRKNQVSLAGGRYCSIIGSIAAQLRYKKENGEIVTFYQTNYSDIFYGLPDITKGYDPIITYARGLEVNIWIEKGLVMATVKNND
ncbi:MAG: hypothetical protein JKX98_01050 [Alcanivoracaceae bacterium]|nr:hypothetical protein [Alcanivoracaceae bacterium]